MSKRQRTDEMDDDLEDLRHYPIHDPLNTMTTLYVNKLKQQENVIMAKELALASLIQHSEDKTIPRRFPKTTFLTVTEPYQKDADELTKKCMEAAFMDILRGLITIRTKELNDERTMKQTIMLEYEVQITNKVRSYHAAGALDAEEVPIWTSRYKSSLEKRANREYKILRMKSIILQEKKEAAATKKREELASKSVDDAMVLVETDAVKKLQQQMADIIKQTKKPSKDKESPKGKAPRKKDPSGKKGANKDNRKSKVETKDKPRGNKGGRGTKGKGRDSGKQQPPSHSKHGTSPSASKGKRSAKKRN